MEERINQTRPIIMDQIWFLEEFLYKKSPVLLELLVWILYLGSSDCNPIVFTCAKESIKKYLCEEIIYILKMNYYSCDRFY